MSEEELKAIRERCSDLHVIEFVHTWNDDGEDHLLRDDGAGLFIQCNYRHAQFYKNAHIDIPKLLDEIERLKQWNGELMALEPKRIKTLLAKEWAEKDRLKNERAIDLSFLQESLRRLTEATHILLFYSDAKNYPHEVNKDGGSKARKLLEGK